jgi:hypothetical protein
VWLGWSGGGGEESVTDLSGRFIRESEDGEATERDAVNSVQGENFLNQNGGLSAAYMGLNERGGIARKNRAKLCWIEEFEFRVQVRGSIA